MAEGLMFTDSGELAAVCATLGIAHPTGYPLFTILGYLWTFLPLPFSTILKLNLFSAFLTALSVLVFFHSLHLLFDILKNSEMSFTQKIKFQKNKPKNDKNKIQHTNGFISTLSEIQISIICTACALMYAFALTVWQQGVIFEVYSLQTLMFMLIIWTLLKAVSNTSNQLRYYLLTSFLIGLGFANHLTTMLILPGVLFLYFYSNANGFDFSSDKLKLLAILIFPMLIGISLYLYLPLRSATNPEFNWGMVSRSFDKFIYHVSGKQYQVWMFSGSEAFIENVKRFFGIFLQQFGWIGVIPLMYGFVKAYKYNRAIFLFLLILVLTCLFYALNYSIHDIDSYFILAFISLLFIASVGVFALLQKYSKYVGFAFMIPIIALTTNMENDQSMNSLVPEYTNILVDNLEENAIVISAQWDYWCSAFWYKQKVENYRPDIVLVEKELLRRTWYLEQFKQWYPKLAASVENELNLYLGQLELFESNKPYNSVLIQKYYIDLVNAIIDNSIGKRPVYITLDIMQNPVDAEIAASYEKVPQGFAFRLEKEKKSYEVDVSKINLKVFLHGKTLRQDHLVAGILESASINLTNIGRYAQFNSQLETAEKAYQMALEVKADNDLAIQSLRQLQSIKQQQ